MPALGRNSTERAGCLPQDDLLSDVQELARQRLSADERAALAGNVSESAQRQLLDDTSYALQVRKGLLPVAQGGYAGLQAPSSHAGITVKQAMLVTETLKLGICWRTIDRTQDASGTSALNRYLMLLLLDSF